MSFWHGLVMQIYQRHVMTMICCALLGLYHSVYCVGLVVNLVMSSGQLLSFSLVRVGLMTSQGRPQGWHSKLKGTAPGHLPRREMSETMEIQIVSKVVFMCTVVMIHETASERSTQRMRVILYRGHLDQCRSVIQLCNKIQCNLTTSQLAMSVRRLASWSADRGIDTWTWDIVLEQDRICDTEQTHGPS